MITGNGLGGDLRELLRNTLYLASTAEEESMLDEFAACRIEKKEDVRDLFISKFFSAAKRTILPTAALLTQSETGLARA